MDQPAKAHAPLRKNGPKILVVEDDATIGEMLASLLADEGYAIHLAKNGFEAAEKLNTSSPDLVLLDLHVPERSGFEILREIRKRDRDYGIFVPVIILTGVYTSRNDKVASLDAGADDFLPKPFDLPELLARVRSLLRVQELYKRSQFLATHDSLTRCYNRRYLLDFLDRQFERFRRYKEPFSYLLIDLDHFKQVNDQAGHDAGDQVLMNIGFRLQDFFRAVDCIARVGGDEFAVVLPDCTAAQAAQVGDRLLAFMNTKPEEMGIPPEMRASVGFSAGIASMPDHTADKDELIRLADQAMYEAKHAGRNQFRVAKTGQK